MTSIILKFYPIYYVKSIDGVEYLLDIYQAIAGCSEIDSLFEANNKGKLKEPEPLKKTCEKSACLEIIKRSVLQPSTVSKFPAICDLEINGFKAQ